jgi:hypothetical protein
MRGGAGDPRRHSGSATDPQPSPWQVEALPEASLKGLFELNSSGFFQLLILISAT